MAVLKRTIHGTHDISEIRTHFGLNIACELKKLNITRFEIKWNSAQIKLAAY